MDGHGHIGSTRQALDYTNRQVREHLARGRGRLVKVQLDQAAREMMDRQPLKPSAALPDQVK